MLCVAFIGRKNKTNDIISEILSSAFDAVVKFMDPENIFAPEEANIGSEKKFIIIDLNTSYGFGNAPENIKKVRKSTAQVPLLVLDHHDDKKFIQPLIDAGASGIISHTPSEAKLTEAVTKLLNGEKYYSNPG